MLKHAAAQALLRIIAWLAIIVGKLLPRDIDEATGKDKRTGSQLTPPPYGNALKRRLMEEQIQLRRELYQMEYDALALARHQLELDTPRVVTDDPPGVVP
jgi:hypothetical protein